MIEEIDIKEAATEVVEKTTIKTLETFMTNVANVRTIDDIDADTAVSMLPYGSKAELKAQLDDLLNVGKNKQFTDEETVLLVYLQSAIGSAVSNGFFKRTTSRSTADWDYGLEHEGKALRSKGVKSLPVEGVVSGNQAVAIFQQNLGLGGPVTHYLWHSGFYVVVGHISETEFIALDMKLSRNKTHIGTKLDGFLFNNESVVYRQILAEFIEDKIIYSSLKLDNNDSILDHVMLQDFDGLVTVLIKMFYPRGYENLLMCGNTIKSNDGQEKRCGHTVKGKLDPSLLYRVDKSLIPDTCKSIIGVSKPTRVTPENIAAYRKNLGVLESKEFEIEDSYGKTFTLVCKSPTLTETIEAGNRWIDTITGTADNILSSTDEEEKQSSYNELGTVSTLTAYDHVIDSIIVNTGGSRSMITEESAITACLMSAVNDEVMRKNILKAIRDYLDSTVVAITGVESYTCPKCSQAMETHPKIKEIIPIDMLKYFFTMRNSKRGTLKEMVHTDI